MKEMDISMEEKRNVNKNLLVIFKWTLKLIPIVLAGLQAINTIISYFEIHIMYQIKEKMQHILLRIQL